MHYEYDIDESAKEVQARDGGIPRQVNRTERLIDSFNSNIDRLEVVTNGFRLPIKDDPGNTVRDPGAKDKESPLASHLNDLNDRFEHLVNCLSRIVESFDN